MGGKTTYWGIILWIQVGDKWGEWSVHIFLLCVWVGGGLEEVYGYEYKSTVIRHKNHINIWEISAQISGWTCAVCVRACSLSLFHQASFPICQDTPQQHKANTPRPPTSICLFCVYAVWKTSSRIQLPVLIPIYAGQQKNNNFPFCSHSHSHSKGSRRCCWRVRA